MTDHARKMALQKVAYGLRTNDGQPGKLGASTAVTLDHARVQWTVCRPFRKRLGINAFRSRQNGRRLVPDVLISSSCRAAQILISYGL